MNDSWENGLAPQSLLPRWFVAFLIGALTAVSTFMVVGLLLAMAGWFRPGPALAGTACASVLILRRAIPALPHPPAARSTHAVIALVLVGAAAVGAWNVLNHGEHLIVDRDPGVYLTTARWLTDEGDLRVDAVDPAFGDEVFRSVPGFSSPDADPTFPQFPHGLPVLLTAGGWLHPELLFVVNPIIGSLALIAVFAVASTITRPIWAAAAAGTLAVTFPFLHMARDTYSEPLAMLLLFGGLWLLSLHRHRSHVVGMLSGGLLGGVCLTRIDGLVALIPIAAVLGLWVRHAIRSQDRQLRVHLTVVTASMAATTILGVADTRYFSPDYYASDLEPRLLALTAAILLSGIASFFVAPFLWRLRSSDWAPGRALRLGAPALGAGLIVVLIWMATIRPDITGLPELKADTATPILDFEDQLATISYRWLEWYLGRPGTAVAFAGLILLSGAAILRSKNASALALPGVVVSMTMLYLVAPNITPDQPWAMRRFLAVSIPGLLIGTMWLLGQIWGSRPRRARWAGPVGAVILLGLVVVPIIDTTRPLRSVQVGYPLFSRIESVCEVVNEEPTAVVIADDDLLNLTLPMTIRSWCGVPAAGALFDSGPAAFDAMALQWERDGRRLLVLSGSGGPVDVDRPGTVRSFPAIIPVAAEVTLTRPPSLLVRDRDIARASAGLLVMHLTEVLPPSSG